jgi:putative ABC transport system substrate-binding protein
VIIEYRWADGHYDRLPAQAADLAHRPVAVLVAVGGDMTAQAAVSATQNTPVVAVFIGDPVANGFVASLNRPGGHVTGISNLNAVIESKRLGLLRELVPQANAIGALQNATSPTAANQKKWGRAAAPSFASCSVGSAATPRGEGSTRQINLSVTEKMHEGHHGLPTTNPR